MDSVVGSASPVLACDENKQISGEKISNSEKHSWVIWGKKKPCVYQTLDSNGIFVKMQSKKNLPTTVSGETLKGSKYKP